MYAVIKAPERSKISGGVYKIFCVYDKLINLVSFTNSVVSHCTLLP